MFETPQALKGVGWIIGCVLSACLHTSMAWGQCIPPPSGLISWWDADLVSETTACDLPDGNTGTMIGGVGVVSGLVGDAFSFDGTSYVRVPPAPNLNVQTFTVDAWVFPVLLDGPVDIIVNKEPDEASNAQATDYEIAIRGPLLSGQGTVPEGNFTFFLGGSSISGDPNEFLGFIDGGAPVPLNTWTHVALTFDGSTAKAYVNGVPTRTISGLSGSMPALFTPVKIGSRSDFITSFDPGQRFNGLIDEVEVFDRALSVSEIQEIFDAGSAGKCKAALDADGDTVDNANDVCPCSDLSPTIVIDGEDTGVANDLLDTGCTISDLIAQLLAADSSVEDIVAFLVYLRSEGFITGQELGAILHDLNDP